MTVMYLILLGLFLTFAAFAIDLGNYYLWQLRLDKAARAGVLAGLGARGLNGWNNVTGNPDIAYNAVRQAVSENLLPYDLPADEAGNQMDVSVNPTWDSLTDQLSVALTYNVPTILIGRIGSLVGYGFNSEGGNGIQTIYLQTNQNAQLTRANVVLILDVSGSMLCPITDPIAFAGQPPCACRRSADPNACGNAATKLSAMAQGVVNFVSQFNPQRDRITVIPFNLAARRLFSFVEYRSINGANSTDDATLYQLTLQNAIKNANGSEAVPAGTSAWNMLTDINTLTAGLTALAGSNTNHCDALAEGIRELETLSEDILGTGQEADRRKLQPFVVFFTDGAPNAMRGLFLGPHSGGLDYYHYAVEWVAPDPIPNAAPLTYRGPGPFVVRTNDSADPSIVQPLFRFSISANNVAPAGSGTCGEVQSNFYDFEKTITQNTSEGARGGPGGCFRNTGSAFNFAIPYTNVDALGAPTSRYQAQVKDVPISTADTTWRDPNWPAANNPPAYGLQKYDELPYYCAIEAADYLRLHFGATIYAIGLGPTNAHSANANVSNDNACNDPLMDADDHSGRKDFFLSRLAFSRQMFANQLLPTSVSFHYQINVAQTARTVSNCSRHRYKTPSGAPTLSIGYTSPTTNDSLPNSSKSDDLQDAFKALRPFRPPSMDYNNWSTTNYRRIETMGEYFPTNDANEVPSIFSNIAKTILLRSTS